MEKMFLLDDYRRVCEIKKCNIDYDSESLRAYERAINTIYHAVCLDIDDTVTYRNKEEKKELIKALSKLTRRHVIVCFVTGRGKMSTVKYLNELKAEILKSDTKLDHLYFKRWYAIINNGCYLLYSNIESSSDFLNLKANFVDIETKESYFNFKSTYQNKIAQILAENIPGITQEEILVKSKASIGENSLRFPFNSKYNKFICEELLLKIKNYTKQHSDCKFSVTKGVYNVNNNTVIEISMTTKGEAIEKFEKIIGIPKNKMLRIGDQGDIFGNDYDMLNSENGFSVKDVSKNINGCWPVVENTCYFDPELLSGVKATAFLLNKLKIYPSVCLEKPEKNFYLSKLAKSEKKNIELNFSTHLFYANKIKYAFSKGNFHNEVWDYIDKETGGFYIKDYEYEILKLSDPTHILFKVYDHKKCFCSKQPKLKFALKNDKGLILRGPINYYYALAHRDNEVSNINKIFLLKLSQLRRNFFKIFLLACKDGHTMKIEDSITRRVFLGVMDSLRDYMLIALNTLLQKRINDKNAAYIINSIDEEVYEAYQLAKTNLEFMYNCLFKDELEINFVQKFNSFIKEFVIPFMIRFEQNVNELKDSEGFNYKKACRVWREIDSFYENIVAMETALSTLVSHSDLSNKRVFFYGLRYGGTELPLIVNLLWDEKKFSSKDAIWEFGLMCLNTNYKENHTNQLDFYKEMEKININDKDIDIFNVLLDDNLVTGRTLQTVCNMAVQNNLIIDKIFVVRYPSLNRVEHMFLENHGAPDTDVFWRYVYGLTSPTPYTRLNSAFVFSDQEEDKYLDELGKFNKNRSHIKELLYKNGIYSEQSEIVNII